MTNNDWGRDYPDPNYGRDYPAPNYGRDLGGTNFGRNLGGSNFGMAAGVNAPVVSPASASVNRGTSQQFSANMPVTWSVIGAGSITSGGLYSLPVAGA